MPTYPYTVEPPIDPDGTSSTSSYLAVDPGNFDLLAYSTTVQVPIDPTGTNATSNYKLAFSTRNPTPHPSIGQLWPRGAGQA